MNRMRALLAGKRYLADPQYEGVILVPVDEAGAAISVPYSDPRLQLEPSWWQWHQRTSLRVPAWLAREQHVGAP